MKLRKALEKAKKAREEAVPSQSTSSHEAVARGTGDEKKPGHFNSFPKTVNETAKENGWNAPVYSESTQFELDMKVLFNNHCVCISADAPELEYYKVLRTKIMQLTKEKGWNTLMITSTQPGEGKTLTAINLALTFSKAYNQTVLLVDGDLRSQNIHKVLGLESDSGLVDYLVDDKPLEKSIIWPGINKLTLISGGRTINEATELLGSQRMQILVQEMKMRYDDRFILFDVPPILFGADALALAPYVDCIVLVIEEGRTSNRDVQKALELIPAEKFLGFVMNRQKYAKSKDYYHYRKFS